MKPGISSLNPYAASYIPLSKREEAGDGTGRSVAPSENQQVTKQNQVQGEASLDFSIHGIEKLLDSENGTQKGHSVYGSHDSCSQNPNGKIEKQGTRDASEMDLAYLGIMFPGISDQSLADVYSVNEGDLDASVEMLHQLEVYPADVSQHLPDSLDVGDVSVIEYPAEGTSERPNQTTSDEVNGSSSCSLKSAS
ncbi:polyadenylate-binding protein-interacting protein 6-like [Telopea speciosissima]|uniref:polyadenylate-binding protein-interacting protein 6-like n=1 Tax=Telopea speciosissima TaxID=54955 RepID=UPI001CC7EFA4|nr:polyadenylate-binding protein-interacting protein 6-like [Telopea speciosissima]XP_043700521.1 polyadenylate-binding protein-interacting protein 6-like [Telopea speciosissima]XP_043700522.1 polyadenylate-binding protein-interacting protein 6-like [Telopea speciosissima]XP_043700523.1 polyadenylate-binding protein-interacting protein 6-like [Telopea speciosissima]